LDRKRDQYVKDVLEYRQLAHRTQRVAAGSTEALARWHHPKRGILGPSAFIPTAEITGSIVGIGQWASLSACLQAQAWLDAGQAAIVKATIGLAKDLGLEIIAEGVETRAQFEALKNWGCTEIQGFYFAKPLSAEDVTLALRKGGVITPQEISLATQNT
jgi:EAL domain-containing protein (putative c-di-GMP-specific phosphodiesterase class I)